MTDGKKPWEKLIQAELREADQGIGDTGATILDFWRWAYSDLVENKARGVFAEFLVARAVGDKARVRDGWAVHDVTMPASADHGDVKIEVKSGGRLQTWKQSGFSEIQFGGLRSRAWNPETEVWEEPAYHADVYVFAVHTCEDPERLDPTDVAQWEFRVLPKKKIEEYGAKSLTWTTVQKWASTPIPWTGLKEAVREAYEEMQSG